MSSFPLTKTISVAVSNCQLYIKQKFDMLSAQAPRHLAATVMIWIRDLDPSIIYFWICLILKRSVLYDCFVY